MWFIVQALMAAVLVLAALAASWFVVWKLILSHFPFFQEILGIRPSVQALASSADTKPGAIQTAEQAAALKKQKQREQSSFVITRSGEQMANTRRRQAKVAEQLAQQQAFGGRGPGQPTTTPVRTLPSSPQS